MRSRPCRFSHVHPRDRPADRPALAGHRGRQPRRAARPARRGLGGPGARERHACDRPARRGRRRDVDWGGGARRLRGADERARRPSVPDPGARVARAARAPGAPARVGGERARRGGGARPRCVQPLPPGGRRPERRLPVALRRAIGVPAAAGPRPARDDRVGRRGTVAPCPAGACALAARTLAIHLHDVLVQHATSAREGTCIHLDPQYGTRSSAILRLAATLAASDLLVTSGRPCTTPLESRADLLATLARLA